MITSKYYDTPNTEKGSGSRGINDAIVDSGLRHGEQKWQIKLLTNPGGSLGAELSAGSNLVIDVAGSTLTQAFTTDTATTIGNFASQIASQANIASASVDGFIVTVTVIPNREVVLENPLVTGTDAGVALLGLEETEELSIIPGMVVLNAEDFEALRIDEISATDTIMGYAELGTAEGTLAWRLKRVTKVGNVTSITYPEVSGTATRDFVFSWTSRAGYTYS